MEVFHKAILTDDDKRFLIIYAKLDQANIDEVTGEWVDRYCSNMLLVLNKMFEYGFVPDAQKIHYWQLFEDIF
jgi:hypothetical protein